MSHSVRNSLGREETVGASVDAPTAESAAVDSRPAGLRALRVTDQRTLTESVVAPPVQRAEGLRHALAPGGEIGRGPPPARRNSRLRQRIRSVALGEPPRDVLARSGAEQAVVLFLGLTVSCMHAAPSDATGASSSSTGATDDVHAVDLNDVGGSVHGFVIQGGPSDSGAGASVRGAGDINGDGHADILVATSQARTYLVFGKEDSNTIELADVAMGVGGFAIDGEVSGEICSAGDVNGDGLADLVFGLPHAVDEAGRSYVVFGKTDVGAVQLVDVLNGLGGFVLEGEPQSQAGAVAGGGDVNGDGLDDIIVGARLAGSAAGRSYVVFGKSGDTGPVLLADLFDGHGGYTIDGEIAYDEAATVSGAGDVNGDGLDDILIGAPLSNATAWRAGRGYVVFGKEDTSRVALSAVASGTGGFVVNAEEQADAGTGISVGAARDVNGDGLDDVALTAFGIGWGPNSLPGGRTYVVFGKASTQALDLSAIVAGTAGFAVNGVPAEIGALSIGSARGGGDVNGDGLGDIIVGAQAYDLAGTGYGAYVVFGKTDTASVELADLQLGARGIVLEGEGGSLAASSASIEGDVNGDGMSDILVGDPSRDGGLGGVYVVFGFSPVL